MRRRFIPVLAALGALVIGPSLAPAQDVPRALSLADAIRLARANSPTYRQFLNDEDPADADVRSAYGGLLPTINSNAGINYTRAGSQTFANQVFRNSSQLGSSYSISASLGISYGQFLAPKRSKAQRRATEENIAGAGVNLVADVSSQYLAVLRAEANVAVVEQQVARNVQFLTQTQARFQVGRGTMVDVRQAEVSKSASDVQLLRARQAATNAKIELLRRMGMPTDADIASVRLTDSFTLTAPHWDLATLRAQAHGENPQLRAAVAQEEAASIGVTSAKAQYLPSFSISTGISGYTQQSTSVDPLLANALSSAKGQAQNCGFQNAILERLTSPHPAPNGGIIDDCNAFAGLDASGTALQQDVAQRIRDSNTGWPFGYTRQPWSISFGVSLPIFDGFRRAAAVSAARAQEDDAREALRARRIDVDGQIQSGLLGVETAWQAATIADSNRAAAGERLRLAQQRFDIGSGTSLEIADAQNAVTQAEFDYVAAVFDYHTAVVGLEATVGRPIR
ncbi:MAG TPA: TolC family protein [Gemmatimonadales bacterium]|nr:TolC family protein [Gemmatimonadales bacterium]